MSKEEILRQELPNNPALIEFLPHILTAMQTYAEQESVEFAE